MAGRKSQKSAAESAETPHHLTGGVRRTKRTVPNLPKAPVPKGYATIIAAGFDTLEETYDLTLAEPFLASLEKAKERAREAKEPVPFQWAERTFHIAGHGAQGGVSYILADDDFLIRIRDGADGWPVSVRYLSAGLWEHGVDDLHHAVFKLLMFARCERAALFDKYGYNIKETVKRFDWAIDFHSPAFTAEMGWQMMGNIVAGSEVKLMPVGTSQRLQTITIGQKSACQVQVYDKGQEITDQSGKSWMLERWRENGWPGQVDGARATDCWRLECRFGKEFLRARGITTIYEIRGQLQHLVAEALYSRRLCRPKRGDSNRRRWPLHPLWQLAADANNCKEMMPLGRKFTLRRETLSAMLADQAAGVLRAKAVLDNDDFSERDAPAIADTVHGTLLRVAGDREKVDGLRERYRYIDENR